MKDRLVVKGVICILCKEKLVLNCVFGIYVLQKTVCDVTIANVISVVEGEKCTLMWPFLISNTNCLLKCFIQILFSTYNSAVLRDGPFHQKVGTGGGISVVSCDEQHSCVTWNDLFFHLMSSSFFSTHSLHRTSEFQEMTSDFYC